MTAVISTPDVLIIGGGAVGVACALELARRGARPMLVEAGATVGGGCSYGSAGLISAGHATPIANPTALREGLLGRFDDSSAFGWRLRPSLLPWLIRFTVASNSARVRSGSLVMRDITTRSQALHEEYAASGFETTYQRRGSVSVYETEAEFRTGRREAAHGEGGAMHRVLDAADLKDLGIELGPAAMGAVHLGQDAHVNSHGFVTGVAAVAAAAGATIRTGVVVRGLRRSGRRITTVETSEGALHPGQVVMSAGVWSSRLARSVGVFVPVEGGKGYHVDLAATTVDPRVPVYLQESKIVVTPLSGRLRLAGSIEIAGLDFTINPRRLATLRSAGERNLRGLARRAVVETWTGLRPCTPDGLPILGRPTGTTNLILATGHAMKGLALAPISGRLVAELACGAAPSVDLAPLLPDRFTALWRGLPRR